MEQINEKIEINKELTKKDIAAVLVTLVGQLSAITANANSKTSMYTTYVNKALKDSRAIEMVNKLKAENTMTPTYKGVDFQISESMSADEKKFLDWYYENKIEKNARIHDINEIWLAGDILCASPHNIEKLDQRMVGWNVKNGEVTVFPEKSIPAQNVKEIVSYLSKIWRKYKSKFNY